MPHALDDERAAAILDRKAKGLLALDEALAELADANCAAAIAALIAERVKLQADVVSRALEAETDEAISVMCRAAGFRSNGYSALLRLRRRRDRGTQSAPTYALTIFSDLSPASAARLLPRMVADLMERQSGRTPAR